MHTNQHCFVDPDPFPTIFTLEYARYGLIYSDFPPGYRIRIANAWAYRKNEKKVVSKEI